jgi:hypothetical protein
VVSAPFVSKMTAVADGDDLQRGIEIRLREREINLNDCNRAHCPNAATATMSLAQIKIIRREREA